MNGFTRTDIKPKEQSYQQKGYASAEERPKHETITGMWLPKEQREGDKLVCSGICKEDGYVYKVFKNDKYEEGSNKPQFNLARIKATQRN